MNSSTADASVTTYTEEQFQCTSCKEFVPTSNRVVHSLVCVRHRSAPKSRALIPSGAETHQELSSSTTQSEEQVAEAKLASGQNSPQLLDGDEGDGEISRSGVSEPEYLPEARISPPQSFSPNEAPRAKSRDGQMNFEECAPQELLNTDNNSDNSELLVECEYCHTDVLMGELEEHSVACGSRTDVCELCMHYVRIRDMKRHRDFGCAVGSTGSAMRTALSENNPSETQPLLPVHDERENPVYGSGYSSTSASDSSWAPVAVAMGAFAAAAAVSVLVRRR